MAQYLIYIEKILFYFVFSFALYFYLKNKEEKRNDIIKKKKMSIIALIIFGVIFGYYGIICGPVPYTSDRLNYAVRFSNDIYLNFIKSNSVGLYFIFEILHNFSHDPNLLFFFMAFFYFLLTMHAYNLEKDSSPLGMLFVMLSTYGLFGFYMYKQAIAIVFIVISFHYLKEKNLLKCIIFVLLGTLFHESTWVVIPLFIIDTKI